MASPGAGNPSQINTQEVDNETEDIVTFFLRDRVEAQGNTVPEGVRAVRVDNVVASCLRRVGRQLAKNWDLPNLITQIQVTPQTAFDSFATVARQIFKDRVYNWRRIVKLLYFGFQLASTVIDNVALIELVIGWVVRFIQDILVDWIRQHGGWIAIEDYVTQAITAQPSNFQITAVFFVSIGLFLFCNYPN